MLLFSMDRSHLFLCTAVRTLGFFHSPNRQTLRNTEVMNIKMLKIHTGCQDTATGLEGTITHRTIDMSGNVKYLHQPKGLNPETGAPVESVYLEHSRLNTQDNDWESVEVPMEILGSQVTHDASGFTGMGIMFIQHPHGCFHIKIQPAGVIEKTRCPIEAREFALVGCSGEKIKKLSPEEKKAEETKRPSPDGEHDFTKAPFKP